MRIPLYQVDAFASEVFSANPAAVCLLDAWLDDARLQSIAAENNLSETAFLVPNAEGFDLRWFTPVAEVALCGHAMQISPRGGELFCEDCGDLVRIAGKAVLYLDGTVSI